MNSKKKNIRKIFGTRKIKLGQLITLNSHVYQCIKYRLNCCKCDCCIFGHDNLWAESYVACRLCDQKGFFKLIK